MRTLITLSCFFSGLLSLSVSASVNVVTSIEPIHQITSSIMQGVGEPELLIKQQASSHHFSFKPSHFTLVKNADLLIWVGRDFESGFQRLPDILSKKTKSLELLSSLEMKHADGHIWYSSRLLPKVANQILLALSKIDPGNTLVYQRNAEKLIDSIKQWAQTTRAMIAKTKPQYILDHDFLSHFEQDMGIEANAVLHDGHDQHSGIHEIREIESRLRESSIKCLLINEPTPSKLARNFADEFDLKIHNIMQPDNDEQHPLRLIDSLNKLSSIMQLCH